MIIEDPPHNDGNGGDEDDNASHGNPNLIMDDEDEADREADEMEAMLKDLTGATAHEGTETEVEGGYDKVFEKLLAESERPLYPGNKHVGRLALLIKLLDRKSVV